MSSNISTLLKHIAAFLFFLLSSIFITFPLVFHLGTMAVGHGDELVISWIQNWVIHALLNGNILTIFDANLYSPYQNSLAFSDTFFISSLISLMPILLIGEPIVAHNVTLILSIIFLGFSLYLLGYYLTRSTMASVLCGVLVIFSPAVLSNMTHVQVLAIAGVPLAILFFLLFFDKKKTNYLIISLLFFVLQTYNSFLPGYFIVFSYSIITAFYWFFKKKSTIKLITKKHFLLILLSGLLLIPVAFPYDQVSKEFQYVRDIRDAIHFALQPEDLLYPSEHTRLHEILQTLPFNKNSQNNEFKPGYLGLVFSLLAIFAIVYTVKTMRKKNLHVLTFITIALVALITSLGPVLHLGRQTIHEPFPIPLPYALFYYILPGFQGFRNSARWEMLFIIAIAVAITLVLHQLLKRYSFKKQIIIYLVLLIGVVVEYNFPMKLVSMPQKANFPKVYSWLQSIPKDAIIIHLPIYNWGNWPHTQEELWREYYGTVNFRNTVNGYTGFSPPPWQQTVLDVNAHFPSASTISHLRKMGVAYVVVHTNEFDLCSRTGQCGIPKHKTSKRVIGEILESGAFIQAARFSDTYVFKLK